MKKHDSYLPGYLLCSLGGQQISRESQSHVIDMVLEECARGALRWEIAYLPGGTWEGFSDREVAFVVFLELQRILLDQEWAGRGGRSMSGGRKSI